MLLQEPGQLANKNDDGCIHANWPPDAAVRAKNETMKPLDDTYKSQSDPQRLLRLHLQP